MLWPLQQLNARKIQLIHLYFLNSREIIYCRCLLKPIIAHQNSILDHRFLTCVPNIFKLYCFQKMNQKACAHLLPKCFYLLIQMQANIHSRLDYQFFPDAHQLFLITFILLHRKFIFLQMNFLRQYDSPVKTNLQNTRYHFQVVHIIYALQSCRLTKYKRNFPGRRQYNSANSNLANSNKNHPGVLAHPVFYKDFQVFFYIIQAFRNNLLSGSHLHSRNKNHQNLYSNLALKTDVDQRNSHFIFLNY